VPASSHRKTESAADAEKPNAVLAKTQAERAAAYSWLLRGDSERRSTPKAEATRQHLIATAIELFAERGYENTSVREIGQRVGLTTGAIYDHFRNKADLLAAAVAAAIAAQLERPQSPGAVRPIVDSTTAVFAQHPSQTALRALLLDAAAAAKVDDAVRDRLREVQLDRLAAWTAVARAHQVDGDLDPTVDVDSWMRVLWALQFGLVIFDVFGIEPPDPDDTGALVQRFLDMLRAP